MVEFTRMTPAQLAEITLNRRRPKPKRKMKQPERAECIAFYDWYVKNQKRFTIRTMIVHVANQGLYAGTMRQRQAFAENLKRMGKVSGALDYVCTPATLPGFWIEFKAKGGDISDNQQAFMTTLDEMGIEHYLVRSAEEARRVLEAKGIV